MKRLLLIALLFAIPLHAATWYATSSSANMSAVTWRGTQGASCAGSGTTLTWASRAAGDIFDANGCTAIAVDQDPGANGKVTLTTDATNTSASGPFTCATASGPATINADITGTSNGVAVLTISGSTGAGARCSITGNITGGTAASAVGVSDSHTVGALTVTGNIVGGSNSSATGYSFTGSSGSIAITGNVGVSTQTANAYSQTNAGTTTITGNCIGSDVSANAGCSASGAGTITIVGSLFNGKRGSAVSGTILWTPGATNCVMFMAASGYGGNATPTTCQASDGTHYQQGPSDASIKTQSNVLAPITYGSYTGTATTSAANSGSAQ